MKGKNENKLDQLFKDGLSGSEDHFAFREEDWASMERLLHNKPSKKAVIRRIIYYSAAIAALLLLAVGLFFFNRSDKADQKKDQLAVKPKIKTDTQIPVQKDTVQNGQSIKDKDSVKNGNPGTENLAKNDINSNKDKTGSTLGITPGKHNQPNNIPVDQNPVNPNVPGNKTTKDSADKNKAVPSVNNNNNNAVDPSKIASKTDKTQNNLAVNPNTNQPDTAGNATAPVQQTKKDKPSLKPILKTGPRFTLAILAAPDLNAVNSFSRNQVGTNFGVQLGIHLSKKFSISTGASYAVKPYQASGSQYNSANWQGVPAANLPNYITANCKVLDIPLNLNYQFYAQGKNKFAVGSGLSSYIMLRENYHFEFADGSGKPAYDIQVDGRNQHWLGVLNLNATYERRINSKFSTIIQPYMKLPITGIGVGRVDLRSTGVAVGVSWNINSALRPK